MNDSFLSRYLRLALKVTGAERGFAVDPALRLISQIQLDDQTLQSPEFMSFATTWLTRALEDRKAVITNNIITDLSKAPKTNTSFSNLRSVVCIPVGDCGALYLDRHIRTGVIPREVIDRLYEMPLQLTPENMENESEEALLERYYNPTIS